MRTTFALAVLLTVLAFAPPAGAHIVEVTTSVSLSDLEDSPTLDAAVHAAVAEVIRATIAFKPTKVALTQARVVGERLFMRLMVVDEEGERLLREFAEELTDEQPLAPKAELRV